MQKRSDKKKKKSGMIKIKLIKVCVLIMFLIFTITSIYAIDSTTNRIMNYKDDKSAFGVYLSSDNSLEINIAGEKYYIRTNKLIDIVDKLKIHIQNIFDK